MHKVAREDQDRPSVSADAGENYADQRSAPRHTLLIRSAKLIAFGMEFLCVIRDASETGISVRTFHPLPDCPLMVLEMQNGDRFEVEQVWRSDGKAGFRFAERIEITRIIELPSSFERRPIRVRLSLPATIHAGPEQSPCEVLDLSQHGAKLSCAQLFAVQQRVKLTAEGLPDIVAKVLWRREQLYGLTFENTFQFGELAQIVAELQSRYPAAEEATIRRVSGAA